MRVTRPVRALLIAVSLVPVDLLANSAWTIPGIVNASGLNGTHFVSDLTLTNPGGAPANVSLSFFPGTASPKSLTLAPGQTAVYSDVAGATFGVSGGAGALSISSDQPLLIRAKTYNTAASGTYGVALPVVSSDRLLLAGDRADSLWISQDASGSSGYRTNIALVFPDASGGAATVTVYDADGNARGSQDFSLDAAGLQQFSAGSFAGAVSIGRAQITVTRGHAAGYAVVVDNVTGDSSLFAFEDVPAGIQDVLVNGVARANGRNGAFFRTDGRFFNPTDSDATVTVAFHASGNANPSPQNAQFVVPSGKIRDVVDVLDSLLGLPVGSAGALRFQSDWPVAILCRTSNVDPSGARPGTFGSQQKPVPLLSFVTSADAGAAITGIRQDAAFRTNVGFAAGGDGASYTLTLKDAFGTTLGTASASLGTFGWTQPNVQDLFPSTTIPQNATLVLKVTAGSVDVFDSSIDNLSGDPVVTPIAPLPVAIPSSATIGPAGGSIRTDDGRMTLRVPEGALTSPTSFSFQATTNDAPQGIGSGYQILPSGISLAKSAMLTLAYGRNDTVSSSAEALTVAASGVGGWFVLDGGSIDPARHTLTVPLPSTAASLRTSRPQPELSTPFNYMVGEVRSWVLVPAGDLTLPTGGRLNLTVSYVGPSSSVTHQGTIQGRFLSSSPNEVAVTWYVNGIELGNPQVGVVVAQGNSATYIAPSCRPAAGGSNVSARIANKSLLPIPYKPFGIAKVKILPRDWIASATWTMDWTKCSGSQRISDFVAYQGGFTFSLDDQLNMTGATPISSTHQLGFATACPGFQIRSLERTTVPDFRVNLVSGNYDRAQDDFVGNTTVSYPVIGGFSFEEFNGFEWVANTQESKALVQIDDFNLEEGSNTDPTFAGQGPWTLKIELTPVKPGGCP